MSLKEYKQKRYFDRTPEPKASVSKKKISALSFVVHKHHASHLHYDLRLEQDGVLKSWAVPKGPSMNPEDKRLAMMVEDHPLNYKDFTGVIPAGNYGAGKVLIWDKGTYDLLDTNGIKKGRLSFILHGRKLKGEFTLIKMAGQKKNSWLLIKKKEKDTISKKTELSKLGAKKLTFGTYFKPMLSYLIDKPFNDEQWIFEIKWDGYRIIAYLNQKKSILLTRNQKDYSDVFSEIYTHLKKLDLEMVIDGEIVVLDKNGKSDFQLLQQYQKTGQGSLVYYVFDILWLKGYDCRSLPLLTRKDILQRVLPVSDKIRISDYISTAGEAFFKLAQKKNIEGIIAKKKDSVYFSGRSNYWLKLKTEHRQEAVIGGYTAPRGSRHYIGAVILGVYEDNRFIYIGHTSGRLGEKDLSELKKRLDTLKTPQCPFDNPPKPNRPVTWLKPKIVCEIAFNEWTQDGHLRQPIFLGLREDKSAKSVHKELAINPLNHNADEVHVDIDNHPLKLTHIQKIFWPKEGYTKKDLIDYYRNVAEFILPHLKDRPEVLHRFPNGIEESGFFQKNVETSPKWVAAKNLYSEHEKHNIRYLLCQNEATLIYLVNLGCIEINPWLSRVSHLDKPDFCVIDLDPEDIAFSAVVKSAQAIHRLLEKIEVTHFLKTSGATGMHIYIPLGAKYNTDQSKAFAELIATIINKQIPEITSIVRLPQQRQKKVYLDFLQNRPNQTIVAPYSVRPQPQAPVSTPIFPKELTNKLYPQLFTIKTILKRLERYGDIWSDILTSKINLNQAITNLQKLQRA